MSILFPLQLEVFIIDISLPCTH